MKKILAIGFAALLLVAFTVPAMAKVDVGGIIFTDFYYFSQENENKAGDSSDYSATKIQVPNITRFKAKWTNENGVGMFIEFGIGDNTSGVQTTSGDANVSLRHAYGWWDVNPGFTLMVGHSTTPFSPLTPTQLLGVRSPGGTHVIGIGFGEFYSGRFPQVRGTFKFSKNARLAIALVDPNVTGSGFAAQAGTVSDNETKMPRIDIGVPLYFGNVKLYPGLFYHEQTYDDVAAGQDDSITAWGVSLGVNAGFGPATITGEIQTGENWGNTRGLVGGIPANITAGKTNDSEALAGWIDVSFKFGNATPHILYGFNSEELKVAGTTVQDWTRTMYGVHVIVPVAKTFLIRPELMVYDYESGVGVDAGKQMIAGICFMIAF